MATQSYVLVFDIGGSHATSGSVDCESLSINCVKSCAIDSNEKADLILNLVCALGGDVMVESSRAGFLLEGACVAFPGPFDYQHGISLLQHKYASLYKRDLRKELHRRLNIPKDRIAFLNDAQAFLLGECEAGMAQDVRRCIGLTLGTGVGSAFLIDGRIVDSGDGVPRGGEIYCLPWGKQTVEETISTRAIQARFRKLSNSNLSVREICLAASTDRNAALVMDEFGMNLGLVIKEICLPFAPDAVVIGGAIAKSAHLFLPSVRGVVPSFEREFVRASRLFEYASLVGAAAWFRQMCSVRQ